ncbi:hypothetical protein [Streptomyces kronopolitis]|uniref:hypothetical protein n=1 Tax=Streptomyces kronopolitis TaxID=1612435 RepID=UPI003415F9FA
MTSSPDSAGADARRDEINERIRSLMSGHNSAGHAVEYAQLVEEWSNAGRVNNSKVPREREMPCPSAPAAVLVDDSNRTGLACSVST